MLGTYHTYKMFLDDLRPTDVKNKEEANKAKRLEQKRQIRMNNSLESGNMPRGGRMDNNRTNAA